MAWVTICWKRWKIFQVWWVPLIIVMATCASTAVIEAANIKPTPSFAENERTSSEIVKVANDNQDKNKVVPDQPVLVSEFNKITEKVYRKNESKRIEESIGFAAEWDYQKSPESFESTTTAEMTIYPSRRIGPGTWHDGNGNWWLFGGHQPVPRSSSKTTSAPPPHILSDLWIYNFSLSKWNLVFRPETTNRRNGSTSSSSTQNNNPFTSAFPENLSFPLICGSRNSGRLAVHGGIGSSSIKQSSSLPHESLPFSEDNVVWLYDTKSSKSNQNRWTSYVCCDACLPDGNTTANFEACPQFNLKTLSWCDHSGIMMLQPSSSPSPVMSIPSNDGDYTTAKTTFAGAPDTPEAMLNWWKFDIDSTEWIKLPPVTIPTIGQASLLKDLLQTGNCRVVSTTPISKSSDELVYILCPSSTSTASNLDRSVILFDPARGTASILGNIHLNNAFTDKKVWQPGRSSMHALSIPDRNMTVISLAYHKLLDFWIHDHLKDKLYSVENVWKGDTLQIFQDFGHFYSLLINIEGSKNEHSFLMINPRNKLADFSQDNLQVDFHVRIVSDKEVFLPQRDAEALDIEDNHHLQNLSKPPVPPETIQMPVSKIPISSTTKPTPHFNATPKGHSQKLLQKMEAHRRNKYRNDIRSQKQKRIPGIKTAHPTNPMIPPPPPSTPSSSIPTSSPSTTTQTTPTPSISTSTVAATTSVAPPTTTTSFPPNTTVQSNQAPSSNPPSTTTNGQLNNTILNIPSSTLSPPKSIDISSKSPLQKPKIPPSLQWQAMMKMMKGDGGSISGVAKTVLTLKRKDKEIIQSLSTPQNTPSNYKYNQTERAAAVEEMIPTPQKLMKSSTSAALTSEPSLVVITNQDNHLSSSSSSSISGQTVANNDKGEDGVAIDEERSTTPAAEGDIDDDHHIRSPGSMIYHGGNSEGAESRDGHLMAMEHGQDIISDSEAVDPTIFFAITLSFFASIGAVLFVRRCVRCPVVTSGANGEDEIEPGGLGGGLGIGGGVLSKEQQLPQIRYSVIPNDLSFHTPIV